MQDRTNPVGGGRGFTWQGVGSRGPEGWLL